tara:strand:+ start:976 stop:1734 length:759 start_codon:yes stop_codon:yes gene_type:complete
MIEIFILSFVQGVTEFLPISSSSHLILISEYLRFENQSLSLDVSCHIGSFIAVLVYFYRDILDFFKNKVLLSKIIISSLPVMIIGFYLAQSGLINNIRNIETITWATIIFGILLYISDKFKIEKSIDSNFTFKSAIFIGIFQILSLIPGVSRSGIAITAARLLNFKRVDSAKLSFLLSIPILGAVSIFGFKNILFSNDTILTKFNLIAILFSFVFSLITIKFFLAYIRKFSMNIFVYYRIILGLILLFITYL